MPNYGQDPCITVNDACWNALNCETCAEPTQPTPETAGSEDVCWAHEDEYVCRADEYVEELDE
jgi:hypothetical protein